MVKITNGVDVIEVTRGAFENIYKSQGFVEADASKEKKQEAKENPEDNQKPRDKEEREDVSKKADELEEETEESEEQKFVKELEEKPLTSWNKKEIKRYCSIVGIDISGTKSAEEAKEIIKNFLAEA